jgi:PAS domain S-box-containing protein
MTAAAPRPVAGLLGFEDTPEALDALRHALAGHAEIRELSVLDDVLGKTGNAIPDVVVCSADLVVGSAEAVAQRCEARGVPLVVVDGGGTGLDALELLRLGASEVVSIGEIEGQLVPTLRRAAARAEGRTGSQAVHPVHNLELLHRAIGESPASVLIADRAGVILYVNRRWTELMGVGAEPVLGQGPLELRSNLRDTSIFEGLWDAVLHKADWTGRLQTRDADREQRLVDLMITPVLDASDQVECFVSIGIDVTETATLQARLATFDKWEAIGQVAGGMAHDLNNHLGVILASGQIALGKLGEVAVPGLKEDLDGVIASARSGKELVQSILASSRRSRINPVAAALGSEVEKSLESLRELVGEKVQVELDVTPGVPIASLDPEAFTHILIQLVANARDAMPTGGTVRIEVRPFFVGDEFQARHPWCPEGTYAEARITDTGMGMDDKTLKRAFEMFFSTKGAEGTGLGLPVAFGLMKQHRGYLLVESRPGDGTTVQLLFPALTSVGPLEATDEALPDHLSSGPRVALYVEDNERLRRAGRRALEQDGFTVLEAGDGAEALELYAEHAGEVDVVISDLVMPRLGGAQLYRRLTEEYGPVPFIITSGHVDEDLEHRDHLPEEVPYLLKPWGVDELTAAVATVLRRS